MKYIIDKQEKYTIIKLEEEKIDSSLAPDLKSKFITLHAEGMHNLILDLSAVKYMDSSGLSALLIANRLCTDDNGMLVLVGVSEHVMKLVKISQLDKVLNLLANVEEGVDAIFLHEIEKDLNDSSQE